MKWLTRIRLAIKRREFTDEDVELAAYWKTCMVSERPNTRHQHNDPEERPISAKLYSLGDEFFHAVSMNQPFLAKNLRKKILAFGQRKSK